MSASRGTQAARLMELLGLSEDELCTVLDTDPLTLLSGQLDDRGQLPILLDLVEEAAAQSGDGVLRRWLRATGPAGRPVDALLRRDFAAFEDALGELGERGFILRGGG
ncbi:MAG TPA: hypothetical protein VKR21_09905 [Solirubrobacteraceae bacterium]|nr:hypothetical protein [Solirubrobacteraceae bacterium]